MIPGIPGASLEMHEAHPKGILHQPLPLLIPNPTRNSWNFPPLENPGVTWRRLRRCHLRSGDIGMSPVPALRGVPLSAREGGEEEGEEPQTAALPSLMSLPRFLGSGGSGSFSLIPCFFRARVDLGRSKVSRFRILLLVGLGWFFVPCGNILGSVLIIPEYFLLYLGWNRGRLCPPPCQGGVGILLEILGDTAGKTDPNPAPGYPGWCGLRARRINRERRKRGMLAGMVFVLPRHQEGSRLSWEC